MERDYLTMILDMLRKASGVQLKHLYYLIKAYLG